MKTIGITGGTGFIGTYLTRILVEKGYKVIIFTRNAAAYRVAGNLKYAHWNPDKGTMDINSLKQLDAAVHLAGAGVADRMWTTKRKKEIVKSRVESTKLLVSQLKEYSPKCKTFVSASAIGYYGPDNAGQAPFTEEAAPFNDFLGDTCKKWENESAAGQEFMRTTILRFGIVLGREGGAFPKLAGPLAFGFMPVLGSGSQVVSWIEINDLARLLFFALEQPKIAGIYNAVSPAPVTHKQLMKTIARQKGKMMIPIPIPSFVLKIILGELSTEVLKSCTVSSGKIQQEGFHFNYPEISSAVKNILNK